MRCVSCGGELVGQEACGLQMDRCHLCGGMWLNRGELDRLVDAQDEDVRWMDLDLWAEAHKVTGAVSERECPYGHGPLATLTYGDSGVQVDVCRTCGGIWLDSGELERIVDYLEEQAESLSLAGYIRESLQEARDLIAGGEGRAAEWKDLRAVLRMLRMRLAVEHPTIAAMLRSLPR